MLLGPLRKCAIGVAPSARLPGMPPRLDRLKLVEFLDGEAQCGRPLTKRLTTRTNWRGKIGSPALSGGEPRASVIEYSWVGSQELPLSLQLLWLVRRGRAHRKLFPFSREDQEIFSTISLSLDGALPRPRPNGSRLTAVAGSCLARLCGPLNIWCIDNSMHIDLPAWVGAEITLDRCHGNSRLARRPVHRRRCPARLDLFRA